MTLDQLLMLITVIDEGSVQAASLKLNKTQPAISKGLKQLEAQMQLNILDRSEYRLKLTSAGKQIYSHAKRILTEADNLKQVTNHLSAGNESEISVAIDGVFKMSYLAPIFAEIQHKFPNTHLIIRQENLSGAHEALNKDEVDIAISPRDNGLMSTKQPDYIFLNTQSLINVASEKFCNRHPKLDSINQIKSECLIMLQDSGSLTKGFEFGVLDGQKKWYVNNFETKKQLILNDLGWGKLPRHMVENDLKNKKLFAINPTGNDNQIDIDFYALKYKILGPVASHLWELLQKSFEHKIH